MNTILNKHSNVHLIWVLMVFLTLLAYAMGKLGTGGVTAMLILLITAGIKATFIIRDFMELRGVSLLWRVIMYGWLFTVCITIAITYIISL